MATKRTGSITGSFAVKKAKTDPVAAKCDVISAALQTANVAPSVRDVLSGVIPFTLGVPKDARHKYQEEAVTMISEALSNIDSGLEQAINGAQELKLDAAKKVESQMVLSDKTQTELSAKKETSQARRAQLAEIARAFQKAKNGLQNILAQQEKGLSEISNAEQTKLKVEALQAEIETIHTGGIKACAKFLDRLLQHVEIDETMKTAIPPALAKESSARGGFDAMVVQQLMTAVEKRLAELKEKINTSEPLKAALQKDVEGAHQSHEASKEKQLEAAGAFVKADKEATDCTQAFKSGQKEVATLRKQEKKVKDSLVDAEFSRDEFKSGPLEAFAFLRDRETASPVPATVAGGQDVTVTVAAAEEEAECGSVAESPTEALPSTAQ